MYLSHFGFHSAPFLLTPNTALFHALPTHLTAIDTLLAGLAMGDGIMQLSGEVGTGKTLICRMLINRLPPQYDLVYLPTPAQCGMTLQIALASELGLKFDGDRHRLTIDIHDQLLQRKANGHAVVVVIDEAQALTDDALEMIRLLGNLETEFEKLLHIVLIGQPELDQRLAHYQLRQLQQRITLRATLLPLNEAEAVAYIEHRLLLSGRCTGLFSIAQARAIWFASGGIPRLINQLAHKSLLAAYSQQRHSLCRQDINIAITDTVAARQSSCMWWRWLGWKYL
ncbi:MSHA biogenesis protein MshM [Photobacterium sp. NCIMB 13483]|uniref:ExeA family protein n=1 Tax=Photobacterium sp. NCIMB 13483 TaxID=2022103 RepID=UPI000D15CBE7|nr:AAA family ATPase [Photobacterium sp. NCIMB 13483]PST85835.1 MSHA biogenesis protein MshM [Photobacterium sp. NCIMB 13483]